MSEILIRFCGKTPQIFPKSEIVEKSTKSSNTNFENALSTSSLIVEHFKSSTSKEAPLQPLHGLVFVFAFMI